ncbi:MAG: hypothetical protein P8Y97_15875 [Candidatus Lokiarchaeota archaeon]
MSKKKMDKHAFCPKCLKEVKPKRKKLDNFNYQLWIIIIISSLGFAIIPLLIYYFFIRKKKYCPKCVKIEKNAQICPYCGVTLKEAKIK